MEVVYTNALCYRYVKFTDMENEMSKEMDEFVDKIDSLCWEYGYEIWPTDKKNVRNEDGTYPTLTIHGKDGEKVRLIYIDGDGRGK